MISPVRRKRTLFVETLTRDTVFGHQCATAPCGDVGKAADDSQGVPATIQELPIPVVVGVPALRLGRVLLMSVPVLVPEIDDELIPVVALPDGVNIVLPADDLDHFVPCLGTELVRWDLAVTREFDVRLFPSRLVLRIVAQSRPKVRHPLLDVFGINGVGHFEPSMLEEVGPLVGREVLVLARHDDFENSMGRHAGQSEAYEHMAPGSAAGVEPNYIRRSPARLPASRVGRPCRLRVSTGCTAGVGNGGERCGLIQQMGT